MLILGINDAHDASACLLKDGRLIIAAMEERFQRIKNISGFPHRAVEACFQEVGLSYADIDLVAMGSSRLVPTNFFNLAGGLTIKEYLDLHENYFGPQIYDNKFIKLADVLPSFKTVGDSAYPLEKIPFITNAEVVGTEMEDIQTIRHDFVAEFLNIDKDKIQFFDHHRCHAYQAYYMAPERYDRVAVVTSDGGGDGTYTSVHVVDHGKFETVHQARNSLIGKIYASITLLLGMHPHRHPYKVMGLAPYATEYHKKGPREIFLNALDVDGLDFVRSPDMKDFFFYFQERLKEYRFDGIAGGLQDFTEIRLCKWFENIASQTDATHFAFGGGVANNVKANLQLTKLGCVDSLFVPPGPSDEGLSIGAAYCAMYDTMGFESTHSTAKTAANAYLGPVPSADDIKQLESHPYIREHYDIIKENGVQATAQKIADGEVVALCIGEMEFGSRALGHRSLVADPSRPDVVRQINDLIKKRDFWMPFTPSVLDECYDDYVINPKDIDSTYMTICFESTPLARHHLAGGLHPYDFTIRPQRVSKSTCSIYHSIITAFYKLTGIGGVLNTSLNIHEKPIVLKPIEILDEILISGDVPLRNIFVDGTLYVRRDQSKNMA